MKDSLLEYELDIVLPPLGFTSRFDVLQSIFETPSGTGIPRIAQESIDKGHDHGWQTLPRVCDSIVVGADQRFEQ